MNNKFNIDDIRQSSYSGDYLANLNEKTSNDYSSSLSNEPSDRVAKINDLFAGFDDGFNDPNEQTQEISGVSLDELKEVRDQLYKIYNDEQPDEVMKEENETAVATGKNKSLVKATRQGVAFSNGNLTKTFIDCTILCLTTASIGAMWFVNIISHIN